MLGTRSVSGSGTSDLQEAMMAYASTLVMTEDRELADRARMGMGMAARLMALVTKPLSRWGAW